MARGRKNYTLDEQLDKITKEIETMENALDELKQAKKEIEDQIRRNRLSELDDLISESGLSFEEVKELLESKEQVWCLFFYALNILDSISNLL